jgi:hypothetical protein
MKQLLFITLIIALAACYSGCKKKHCYKCITDSYANYQERIVCDITEDEAEQIEKDGTLYINGQVAVETICTKE